jgi:glutathione S-transferase
MTDTRKLTFYHSPQTRSTTAFALLEELGAPYDIVVLDMKKGEQREPAYLNVNPMGKVPAITHGDALITEQAAIAIYLADLFPEKKLAPALTDPLRGPYLRWMLFYNSCFEPAVMDKAMKRDAGRQQSSGYGDYDSVMNTIIAQLKKGPYILGDTFTAADIVWGSGLGWTSHFKLVPDDPAITDYAKRITSRPCFDRVREKDNGLTGGS